MTIYPQMCKILGKFTKKTTEKSGTFEDSTVIIITLSLNAVLR